MEAKVEGKGQLQAWLLELSRTMKLPMGVPSPEGTDRWNTPKSAPYMAERRDGQKWGLSMFYNVHDKMLKFRLLRKISRFSFLTPIRNAAKQSKKITRKHLC